MSKSKSKRNIAFFTHGNRNIGGGEYFLLELITKINREVFNPIVFYSKKNKVIEQIEKSKIQVVSLKIANDITSIYRDKVNYGLFSLIKYTYSVFKACFELNKKIKYHNVKILYAHDNLSKIISIPVSKICDIKTITVCHDQLGNSFIENFLLTCQKYLFSRVVCVSECVGRSFSKNGKKPDHISVLYGGIDPNKWKCRNNIEAKNIEIIINTRITLGIIAVFDDVKGHITLFEAIKIMVKQGVTKFKCYVVGEGRENQNLREWVNKNNLSEHIIFKGYITNPFKILNEIDISIVPSLKESFGMSAVEAMSMKIPVIASAVGGLTEVVEHNVTGILVPPSSPKILADSIIYLIEKPNLRKKMGIEGRKRVKRLFDIKKNLKKFEDIMLEL